MPYLQNDNWSIGDRIGFIEYGTTGPDPFRIYEIELSRGIDSGNRGLITRQEYLTFNFWRIANRVPCPLGRPNLKRGIWLGSWIADDNQSFLGTVYCAALLTVGGES